MGVHGGGHRRDAHPQARPAKRAAGSVIATRIALHLPRPHPGQQRILDEARRFNVVDGGRRLGKSKQIQSILIRPALDGYPTGYFCPTYKLLQEQWRELVSTTRPVQRSVNNNERRIELITGGSIEAWSLKNNPDAGRSRKYMTVAIDEAASAPNLEAAWTEAIRATLTDYKGSAWFMSTPKGMNYFSRLYNRGQNPGDEDWMSWQMPTSINPFIDRAEIEAARADLPEKVFAQEYLAQFLDMEGTVFRRIQEAASAEPQDVPTPGHEYAFGVDWGKLNDWTAICVLDLTTSEMVHMARFNQIDYQTQLGRLEALYNMFMPRVIKPEANSIGEPLIEQLRAKGLPIVPFTTTNATKQVLIDSLSVAFDSGQIRVIDDAVLVGELVAYEAERLPSGMLRYGAPSGPNNHDDCVMALALAWSCLSAGYDWAEAYGLVTCGTCGRKFSDTSGSRPCPYCHARRSA